VPKEGANATYYGWLIPYDAQHIAAAHEFLDFMLRPDVQKMLAEAVWYSPANKKVKLDAKYDAKLLTTEAKVATLIQPDWKWYNERKDDIDARVTKILKS